ncbi:MAG TPA: hypothetical protein VF746_18625 [Longimicrobium sp.]|jgi:hypothetical protein
MQQEPERRGAEPERGLDAAESTGTGTGNDSMGIANAARRDAERGGGPEGMGEPNTVPSEREAGESAHGIGAAGLPPHDPSGAGGS